MGTLLGHGGLTKEEAREMLIEELGDDPKDALEEVERTYEAVVRFHFLARQYAAELLAAQQAAGDPVDVEIHMQRVLRYYFLYLLGAPLFMDTSSSYTNVVYLRYLLDTARIHEHNWGVATQAYNYHIFREGCLWKGWILQHFPGIIGWGEVLDYTEAMPRARAFVPFIGNQVPDPYMHYLDRMAAEDVIYDNYAAHCERVPRDEITIYSRWLAASSNIIVRYLLERVMRQFRYCQTIPHDTLISATILMTRRQIHEVFVD
ncbi:uncharacterized protein LOC131622013 [Vicia villosa]|uniref:uncharacterized protein LOC131622013 n=1 Tax=Vicia villosa TaxID=3911 RepID=UPI00273B7A3A|nr:uncharacterized protein LOC131622013 [Vicia villosa]